MIDHEPTPDLLALAEEMFTEAIEAHVAIEDNRNLVHDTFSELVRDAIGTGQITITGRDVVKMTDAYLWQTLNSRAGRRTQSLLKSLVAGQMSIAGIDDVLDQGITVGNGRRTTIRHLNPDDVKRMVDERALNLEKQTAAFVEFRDEIAVVITGWLDEFGSIPRAIAAGAIELTDPQQQSA
jgi:hypothetical protein